MKDLKTQKLLIKNWRLLENKLKNCKSEPNLIWEKAMVLYDNALNLYENDCPISISMYNSLLKEFVRKTYF